MVIYLNCHVTDTSIKNAKITSVSTTGRTVWLTRDKVAKDGSTSNKAIAWQMIKEGDYYKIHTLIDEGDRWSYEY